MTIMPELARLENSARAIVRKARRKGTLSTLTQRLVRQQIEMRFSLTPGTLDAKKYSRPLKTATMAAIEEVVDPNELMSEDEDADASLVAEQLTIEPSASSANSPPPPSPPSAPTPPPPVHAPAPEEERALPPNLKRRRKVSKAVVSDSSDVEAPPPPVTTSKSKSTSKSPERKPRADASTSAAGAKAPATSIADASSSKPKPTTTTTKSKTRTKPGPRSLVPPHVAGPSVAPPAKTAVKRASTSAAARGDDDEDSDGGRSDSEMSVLIDEPPTKRRRGADKAEDSAEKEGKAGKAKAGSGKGKEPLSKDEETIKRLKSLVLACGLRKRWASEFDALGLGTPAGQIAHLRGVLAGLGMPPRGGLEHARRIRTQRELAAELEDVRTFERKWAGDAEAEGNDRNENGHEEEGDGASRAKGRAVRGKGAKGVVEIREEVDESEEEQAAAVRGPKRATAARSIMAFLGDQSDSD